ncbi:MAG: RES domain-containing protein [Chloroflexi bacterium]|nr:RES domain-containing protein [Chloroflexota bacterium]
MEEVVWRVGWAGSPLDFLPRNLASWQNRFDDVHRRFRTLYVAHEPVTCLREVLADLRPNTK